MESLKTLSTLKYFLLPRNNHWVKRILLVFTFIIFDYTATLVFCQAPHQEANLYARNFMQIFGIPLGLTLFVLVANLPIYMTLSLDSHVVRLPFKVATFAEILVDLVFAWFVAGSHFHGGTSWFWNSPQLVRQSLGALLYMSMTLLVIKPYKPQHNSSRFISA